jgi:hypothetical protein
MIPIKKSLKRNLEEVTEKLMEKILDKVKPEWTRCTQEISRYQK